MSEAVFTRTGDRYLPGPHASGPWGADRLHGGPVFGLLARAIERAAPDPELCVARLSFDLFRSVPREPLAVRVELLRQSSRLCLMQAALCVDDVEYTRATALLLRGGDGVAPVHGAAPRSGPEGLSTETLMRGAARPPTGVPPGFHTRIETRWVPRDAGAPLSIWFRLPIALVADEPTSPLQRAVALADFCNAIASIAARERSAAMLPYINVDATLYLARRPEGEWFCLTDNGEDAERGVGIAECLLADERGPLGRVLQARVVNRPKG